VSNDQFFFGEDERSVLFESVVRFALQRLPWKARKRVIEHEFEQSENLLLLAVVVIDKWMDCNGIVCVFVVSFCCVMWYYFCVLSVTVLGFFPFCSAQPRVRFVDGLFLYGANGVAKNCSSSPVDVVRKVDVFETCCCAILFVSLLCCNCVVCVLICCQECVAFASCLRLDSRGLCHSEERRAEVCRAAQAAGAPAGARLGGGEMLIWSEMGVVLFSLLFCSVCTC
jgi:hypothetical protein